MLARPAVVSVVEDPLWACHSMAVHRIVAAPPKSAAAASAEIAKPRLYGAAWHAALAGVPVAFSPDAPANMRVIPPG
jgi:hypothetical protein